MAKVVRTLRGLITRTGSTELVARAAMFLDAANWRSRRLDRRRKALERAAATAVAARDDLLMLDLQLHLMSLELQAGEFAAGLRRLTQVDAMGRDAELPTARWQVLKHRTGWALGNGSLAERQGVLDEVLSAGRDLGHPDAQNVWAIQTYFLWWRLDRSEEQVGFFKQAVDEYALPAWRAGFALGLYEIGDVDRARQQVDILRRRPIRSLSKDGAWLLAYAMLAETAVYLRDTELCSEIYDFLTPYSGWGAMATNCSVHFGFVDHYLGLLGGALGRIEAAYRYFERAVNSATEAQHENLAAYSLAYWAELIDSTSISEHEGHHRASTLRDRAQHIAESNSLIKLTRQLSGELPHFSGRA
jgi:tetratricopeptide (TPR) repeat protein